MPRTTTPKQLALELPCWGGARRGAGRKAADGRSRVPHVKREEVRPSQPVHVSFRMADHVWNLRSERAYRVIYAAIRGAQRRRAGFRVVHFSVQGNHLHLIVESSGTRAFVLDVRALSIRLARGLNQMMGRRGRVFADRYHAHVLRTPAEVRNAVRYVLKNFESHAERRGEPRSKKGWVDPFSSAATKAPREAQLALFIEPATAPAETWLLRRAGEARCWTASQLGRPRDRKGARGRAALTFALRPARMVSRPGTGYAEKDRCTAWKGSASVPPSCSSSRSSRCYCSVPPASRAP